MPNPISQPTYPTDMTEADLGFSKLMDVLIADNAYFGISVKYLHPLCHHSPLR
ncbi:MAG: hypothetical protein LHW52_06065 [Candidatus Cloacimonetes bacterium]|jgi:hypothetical protein|nr:hypothetical protein [Candidatus Cloacimonadota bacterium]